jgi:hypothetical protein
MIIVVLELLPFALTKRPVIALRATVLADLTASFTLIFPARGGVLIDLYFMAAHCAFVANGDQGFTSNVPGYFKRSAPSRFSSVTKPNNMFPKPP